MTLAYLSLGSNTKNKEKLIEQAVGLINLSEDVKLVRTSALYETEPWGVKNQNWFLNLAAEIKTSLSASELLEKMQLIEKTLGRDRTKEIRWGERPIDIDIIFYGQEIVNLPNLTVPHINMHNRAFVLVPLLELIPDFKHPVLNKTISEIYDSLEDVEDVFLYGTREVLQ